MKEMLQDVRAEKKRAKESTSDEMVYERIDNKFVAVKKSEQDYRKACEKEKELESKIREEEQRLEKERLEK